MTKFFGNAKSSSDIRRFTEFFFGGEKTPGWKSQDLGAQANYTNKAIRLKR